MFAKFGLERRLKKLEKSILEAKENSIFSEYADNVLEGVKKQRFASEANKEAYKMIDEISRYAAKHNLLPELEDRLGA